VLKEQTLNKGGIKMKYQQKSSHKHEQGGVLVLVAVCMTLFFTFLAMAFDFGLIVFHQSHLKSVSDATALAAARELIDEDALQGSSSADQTDDIIEARDYTELYASLNIDGFSVDRNEGNAANGGVVAGYIEDPLDMNCELQTEDISLYNSIAVTTSYTEDINGPLQLFFGNYTGLSEVAVEAKSVATIEDRVVGFTLEEGEVLPMLPFAAYEDSWTTYFDGVSDFDQYSVNPDTGAVTSGSDGIPEFLFAPFYPNQGIPGHDGNGRTLFITNSISVSAINSQITDGMVKADLECSNIGEMVLTQDAFGDFGLWVPGDQYLSSSWHTTLNNIKGEKRILPLFRSISSGMTKPIALRDADDRLFDMFYGPGIPNPIETCASIQEWYEISGFKAVTVCESFYPDKQKLRRVYMQPVQITETSAVIDSEMKHSKTVYTLSLTR
jgi:Flp pilus assembly protein TadG